MTKTLGSVSRSATEGEVLTDRSIAAVAPSARSGCRIAISRSATSSVASESSSG